MIAGRVWKFGDSISTDLILPGPARFLPVEQQKRSVFLANRPGWSDQVAAGDIIIGGRNFGLGSARPAARPLRELGIACILTESISSLFFRNCVNFGLLAFQSPGISTAFEEGQIAEVSIEDWQVRNQQTGATLAIMGVPETLLNLMREGGVYPLLERRGLISPASR